MIHKIEYCRVVTLTHSANQIVYHAKIPCIK